MSRAIDPEITRFILANLDDHPDDIGPLVAAKFGVTRQTVSNYMVRLIKEGLVAGRGKTNARQYALKPLAGFGETVPIIPGMSDDEVWRAKVYPALREKIPANVLDISQYAFTEMFNNVIDHSGSETCDYYYQLDAIKVRYGIRDYGVGIFEKIRDAFKLSDRRQALLELSKGKLTTDASRHSGEGIFFTSRMMDRFSIGSLDLYYSKRRGGDGWLVDVEETPGWDKGTLITMEIRLDTNRTTKEVFDLFSTGEDYGFAKTHVPLTLAKYEGESLVSRSQAKRLMARVDRFLEVILDFTDIDTIGQAFADEIFRVFAQAHPHIKLTVIGARPEIAQMISRARKAEADAARQGLVSALLPSAPAPEPEREP